ncbi:MAG: secondary thiamine-phosphate synthase enzyme YjbQ [Candidatus Omnitrophota bacterium]
MEIKTQILRHKTKGAGDMVDITADIRKALGNASLQEGLISVFVVGSTASITSFEYEPGMISDMRDLYERIAPSKKHYLHNETWNDANGFSHVRAALQGAGMVVPFQEGNMLLSTWQQVVLTEFDTRPRDREIILTFIGE